MRDPTTIPDQPPTDLLTRPSVSMVASARALVAAREMVSTLAERELRIRYKQAILGIAWALLQPLTLVVTFTFFLGRVARFDIGDVDYALFALCGLIPWTFFASAVGQGGVSLLQNLQLVNKINCPREVFPLAMVGVAAVDTATSMVAVVVLFAAKTTVPHLLVVPWAPVLIAIEVLFTAGVALLVSSLVVHVRDLRHVVPVVLQMGIVVSPVMWPYDQLGETLRYVYAALNPLGPVIDAWRRTALLGVHPEYGTLAVGGIAACIVFLVGFRVFKRLEGSFADLL